ncbi:hypothetical protein SASPL_153460 [Salvia splendens]|uniref:EGF-like domain-containing protein n=1 Tax=Salvia splendens TaxID=180675 RepID=A0A8X8Z1T3_SALSN|nr:hypothetical protein SASPL_153460 [Salvia splendens]
MKRIGNHRHTCLSKEARARTERITERRPKTSTQKERRKISQTADNVKTREMAWMIQRPEIRWHGHHQPEKFREKGVTAGCCWSSQLMGCFQIDIPKNVSGYVVTIASFTNYTIHTWDISNCSYAFVVEESAFKFSKDNLTNLSRVKSLPVVADWVVRNETCGKAMSNPTGYACVSANSTCYNPTNGYGYRCRCKHGFQGNPYLPQGCIDIDECLKNLHNCNKDAICANTIGNYTCTCLKNYEGDGMGEDGCKRKAPKDMKITYISIGK